MDNQNNPFPIPQPEELTNREKEDAMAGYLMMFAAWAVGLPLPSLNLVAAVVYYFLNNKKSRFVAFHAFQSLITQLPTTILNMGVVAWFLRIVFTEGSFSQYFLIYVAATILLNLLYVIFSIVACVEARKGRFFYFLVFGRLAYNKYYGPNAKPLIREPKPNTPPA